MFRKILVPVDGSTLAAAALSHVLAVANQHAAITLIRVVETCSLSTNLANPLDWQLQRTEASAYLDELMAQCTSACDASVEKVTQGGPAAERILEQAHEHGHDLIVISSHGRNGLSGWNVSSVAHKVINRSGVSILLVRSYRNTDSPSLEPACAARYRRILVPLDGSLRSEVALPVATQLAKQHDADLLFVHGIVTPELFQKTPLDAEDNSLINSVIGRNKRQAEDYFSELSQRLDVALKTYVLSVEDIAEGLHRFAQEKEVDLVILSAHGRTGTHAWPYGSVTASFIAYGTTHLLIVQDLPWQAIEESSAEQASKDNKLASMPTLGVNALAPEIGLAGTNGFALHISDTLSFQR